MKLKKYKILFILIILLALIICALYGYTKIKNAKFVEINNKLISIELANTPEKKYLGLSGRKKICDDCGMLFMFEQKAKPTFVMRDMDFGLDIIWIKDNKIVKIDENLPPEGSVVQNYFTCDTPVDYVLEVNSGFAQKNNIKIDNVVKIKL